MILYLLYHFSVCWMLSCPGKGMCSAPRGFFVGCMAELHSNSSESCSTRFWRRGFQQQKWAETSGSDWKTSHYHKIHRLYRSFGGLREFWKPQARSRAVQRDAPRTNCAQCADLRQIDRSSCQSCKPERCREMVWRTRICFGPNWTGAIHNADRCSSPWKRRCCSWTVVEASCWQRAASRYCCISWGHVSCSSGKGYEDLKYLAAEDVWLQHWTKRNDLDCCCRKTCRSRRHSCCWGVAQQSNQPVTVRFSHIPSNSEYHPISSQRLLTSCRAAAQKDHTWLEQSKDLPGCFSRSIGFEVPGTEGNGENAFG